MNNDWITYRITDIVWDAHWEDVDLPESCILHVHPDTDIAAEGADILSDEFDWCVISFNFKKVEFV